MLQVRSSIPSADFKIVVAALHEDVTTRSPSLEIPTLRIRDATKHACGFGIGDSVC